MGLSNLLETTAAKFNKLDNFIEICDLDIIIKAHRSQDEAEKNGRKLDVENRKKKMQKIIGKNLTETNQLEKLQIGSAIIETNPSLIPEDLASLKLKHKQFQKEAKVTGTSALGEKQFKLCLLLCIKHLLNLAVPRVVSEKDYEWSESISKIELDKKVAKVLFLYKGFESEIRSSISFG